MKKTTFDVIDSKDNKLFINTVNGQEVKIDNYTFGMYKKAENLNWYIIDFKTGRYLMSGKTQKEAIEKTKNIIDCYIKKILDGDAYNKLINDFKQLKIDSDPYYYVVNTIDKTNCKETNIFMTYEEADTYNNNIIIDKKLKNN
jgi:hypothetical protein